MYNDTWINKKEKRYLIFFFEDDVDYVTVNDWTGSFNRNKSKTLDAYKAYIKDGKLILPAENSDHHSPYCEIVIANNNLIFKCNGGLNFTDTVLVKSPYSSQTIFKKLRE